MAAISLPSVAPPPAPAPADSTILPPADSTILPPADSDAMVCDDETIPMQTHDDHTADPSSSIHTNDTAVSAETCRVRIVSDESTQVALDALAALAAASTAVSSVPFAHQQRHQPQPQEVTPHQTSSDDDDSEIMPPPPPRRASAVAPAPAPSFAFLHDDTSYGDQNSGGKYNNNCNGIAGGGRLRSASNPEGMEKWDFYSRRNDRQHFVLPSSILEEELASTRRVLGEVVDDDDDRGENAEAAVGLLTGGDAGPAANDHEFNYQPQQHKQERKNKINVGTGFQQHWVRRSKRSATARFGTSPNSIVSDLESIAIKPASKPKPSNSADNPNVSDIAPNEGPSPATKSRKKLYSPPEIISSGSPPPGGGGDDTDEFALGPEELLRRARLRLLEDLSEGGGGDGNGGGNGGGGGANGEKGGSVLILPHSLSKYKEVYNKNGRIGIYTPAERAAIIQKFNAKRARRVWNKKIRYNCRKNLADRRMRVKGRFVKRSVESGALPGGGSPSPTPSPGRGGEGGTPKALPPAGERGARAGPPLSQSGSPPTSGSPLTTVDEEMPDVEDEEAEFAPSEDMPYRRARRYTIT